MNTKREFVLLTAMLSMAVLPACWVYSLNPLYTDDDHHIVHDPALVGRWQTGNSDDCVLVITADAQSQSYTLENVVPPENKTGCDPAGKYEARLLQLGSARFLDASPMGDASSRGFIAPHSIFKIAVSDNLLSLVPLRDRWLCRAARENQLKIGDCVEEKESDPDPDFVLTARTEVLQKFVKSHADNEQLFYRPDGAEFHRVGTLGVAK